MIVEIIIVVVVTVTMTANEQVFDSCDLPDVIIALMKFVVDVVVEQWL